MRLTTIDRYFFVFCEVFIPSQRKSWQETNMKKSAISLILMTLRVKQTIKSMLITNLISRYMKLLKAAFSVGDGAK